MLLVDNLHRIGQSIVSHLHVFVSDLHEFLGVKVLEVVSFDSFAEELVCVHFFLFFLFVAGFEFFVLALDLLEIMLIAVLGGPVEGGDLDFIRLDQRLQI